MGFPLDLVLNLLIDSLLNNGACMNLNDSTLLMDQAPPLALYDDEHALADFNRINLGTLEGTETSVVSLEAMGIDPITIKTVFDEAFSHVKFDKELCKRIVQFSLKYMNRNDDHSAFFGGVLLGVNPIRFLDTDRETWYEDVLDIDEDLLYHAFRKVKSINFDFKVMSDVFNYTPIYLCHRLEQTNLPQAMKKDAMTHAFMVLHYRFLTSLLIKRFKYPADPEVAAATYQSLSGRFDIRRYGSWRALLKARAEDLISSNSIYRKTILNFSPDPSLIRVVTDTQGRIREVVKKIYAIYLETLQSGGRIRSTSDTFVNTDGEMVLKDRKNGYAGYLRYINTVIPSERDFVRDELLEVVASTMTAMPPALFKEALYFLSRNYNQPHQGYLEELVKENLLYTFDYLQSNRSVLGRNTDLALLLSKLRALLMASRSSDPVVLKLRSLTEKMVFAATGSRNAAVIASVRTGCLLYLTLRTMTKAHYTR